MSGQRTCSDCGAFLEGWGDGVFRCPWSRATTRGRRNVVLECGRPYKDKPGEPSIAGRKTR